MQLKKVLMLFKLLPKAIHRFSVISIKILKGVFIENPEFYRKFCQIFILSLKGPQIAKAILKRSKCEELYFVSSKCSLRVHYQDSTLL